MKYFEIPVSSAWFLENTASTIAESLAKFHHEIFGLLLIIFTSISILMFLLYYRFVFKWNSRLKKNILFYRKNYFNLNIVEHPVLEIVWTILPTIFLYSIIVPSLLLLYLMDGVAEPQVTVKIIAHQWYWTYEIERPNVPGISKKRLLENFVKLTKEQERKNFIDVHPIFKIIPTIYSWFGYKNDPELQSRYKKRFAIPALEALTALDSYLIPTSELPTGSFRNLEVDNSLVLPSNTHIRFIVTSDDVIHSFSIPALGLKIDAVPGRLNSGTAYIKRNLIAYGQCSELCGSGHAQMPLKLIAK